MSATLLGQCPGCSSPVPLSASEGLCAACLLLGVLQRGDLDEVEPEPQDPALLQRCGEYEIEGVIARGGMGVVFRAHQAGLSRTVALKMIAAADLAGPDEVRRFRLEAELIAKLEHPNIVPIYATGEHDGRPFFVMKLADSTLDQRLREKGPLESREAAGLMVKVARAVQYAHGHGVLHRDLKPANILLDAGGEPLVSDFGLARLAHGSDGSTIQGSTLGTPAYMPPEQARGEVTTVSDVYGLGAILYHLLTGRPPFSGKSALEILKRVESEEPVHPRLVSDRVERDPAVICLKCLEKNPARRYASAAELADDLDRWLRGEPVLARPAPVLEKLWKWARRRPALASLLGAGVIGASTLMVILVSGKEALRRERNFAQAQERIAREGTARAEASEQQMKFQVYASDIFLARRSLADGNMGTARRILESHIPAEGGPDLRGFEWHALRRQCRGDEVQVYSGQEVPVNVVSYHPEGRLIATAGRDGTLHLLEAADGTKVQHLPNVPGAPKLIELAQLANLPMRSPETPALLAGPATFDEMRMRAKPSGLGELASMDWSPDGQLLFTAGPGAYPRLWKMPNLELQGFIPHKNAVQAAVTGSGRHLVLALAGPGSNYFESEVQVYDAATLRRTAAYPGQCACFALARAVPLLAVTDKAGNVAIYNTETGERPWSWPTGDEPAAALACSPDGRWLAVLSRHGIKIYEVPTGKLMGHSKPGQQSIRTLAFSPDSRMIAAGGVSQYIYLIDAPSGTIRGTWRGHDDEILSLTYSPDGRHILSGSTDGTARLWEALPRATNTILPSIILYDEPGTLEAVSSTGQYLLGSGKDDTVRCFDTVQKRVNQTPGDIPRRALGFSHEDDGRFVTIQKDSAILEWWLRDGTPDGPPVDLQLPGQSTTSVCPAAGIIAVSAGKGIITLHDWRSGVLAKTIPKSPHTSSSPSRLIFSPRGRFLGSFSWPRSLSVFDRQTGQWLPPQKLSVSTTGPIVFSRDEEFYASGGDDNAITVRETTTGRIMATLRAHMAELKSLSFSADGRTLASSSGDNTIRLWHVPTWRELGVLHRNALCPRLLFTTTGLMAEEYANRWLEFPGR